MGYAAFRMKDKVFDPSSLLSVHAGMGFNSYFDQPWLRQRCCILVWRHWPLNSVVVVSEASSVIQ